VDFKKCKESLLFFFISCNRYQQLFDLKHDLSYWVRQIYKSPSCNTLPKPFFSRYQYIKCLESQLAASSSAGSRIFSSWAGRVQEEPV
jgi:hypothetical protein